MKPRLLRCTKLHVLLGVLAFGLITIALVMQQMHFRHASSVSDGVPAFKLPANLRTEDLQASEPHAREDEIMVNSAPIAAANTTNEEIEMQEAAPSIELLMQEAKNRSNHDDVVNAPPPLHNAPPIVDVVDNIAHAILPAIPNIQTHAPTQSPTSTATNFGAPLVLDVVPTDKLLLHSLYPTSYTTSSPLSSDTSPVLTRVHRALKYGTLASSSPCSLSQLVSSLADKHQVHVVFDFSSTCVSCSIAQQHPTVAFVSSHTRSSDVVASSNQYVASHKSLTAFTSTTPLRCIQIITSYEDFISHRLPFEVEEVFGQLLSRCMITLVPKALPMSSYFTFWDDVEMFMHEAISTYSSSIFIRFNMTQSSRFSTGDGFTLVENINATLASGALSVEDIFHLRISSSNLPTLFAVLPPACNTSSTQHCVYGATVGLCSMSLQDTPEVPLGSERVPHAPQVPIVSKSITNSFSSRYSWLSKASPAIQSSIVDNIPSTTLASTQKINVTTSALMLANTTQRRRLNAYTPSSPASSQSSAVRTHWDLPVTEPDWLQSQDMDFSTNDETSRNVLLARDRELLKQLKLRERSAYTMWSSLLLSADLNFNVSTKILLVGSHITMLSIKIAQQFLSKSGEARPLVISVVTDGLAVPYHDSLLERMKVSNNLLCSTNINMPFSWTLLSAPDIYDIAIYQQDVIYGLLSSAIDGSRIGHAGKSRCDIALQLFEEQFATLLSTSNTVFIDMPTLTTMKDFMQYTDPLCVPSLSAAYISWSAVFEVLASRLTVRKGDVAAQECIDESGNTARCFRITVYSSHGHHIYRIDNDLQRKHGSNMVSLYSILHFQPVPTLKRHLARLFIDFPSFLSEQDYPSWELFVSTRGNQSSYALYGSNAGVVSGDTATRVQSENAKLIYEVLVSELESYPADLSNGRFSIVDHDSGLGHLSLRLALHFPEATVLSLERQSSQVKHHVTVRSRNSVLNNAVCRKPSETSDASIIQLLYESPELFRYQIAMSDIFDSFIQSESPEQWGSQLGPLLSIALTSFIATPSASRVSLAMMLFFSDISTLRTPLHTLYDHAPSPHYITSSLFDVSSHPTEAYQGFETLFLMSAAKVKGGTTQVRFSPMFHRHQRMPIMRCDIVNMTRKVHHHYDYAKDGHSRTYTMHVEVNRSLTDLISEKIGRLSSASVHTENEHFVISAGTSAIDLPVGIHTNRNSLVSVTLHRDKDDFPIPYTSIYGITLISVLRMGLEPSIRDAMFSSFLSLPLYEDMAPWNIVLNGKDLAYIDYDTRDVVFDADVPKAYQVMSVLMNYKRTVEDFKRCGSKASTIYGFGFVSDCVGTLQKNNLKYPVPCGDGTCHSDYISCLKSLSRIADEVASMRGDEGRSDPLADAVAQAMSSGIASFNDKGLVVRRFLRNRA